MKECDMGRTDQTYYRPYIEVSKISNNIIDFDLNNVLKALQQDGKSDNAEKVVKKVQGHFLDSSRLIKRSFGNKLECDFQMYNWGVALTADLGMESDRVDLLILTYGRTSPNRITLNEFKIIILKHSSHKKLEKRERKVKWIDLMASFKIQAGSQRSEDVTKSIGKRQLRAILDVNDIQFDFDLSAFAVDLRNNDRYMSRLHGLLVDDPLISGKRLASKLGYAQAAEERLEMEKIRINAFHSRIAAEEAESSECVGVSSIPLEEVEENLRSGFQRAADLQENRAATRAIRMAEKAELRTAHDLLQTQRHAAASVAAKLLNVQVAEDSGSSTVENKTDTEEESNSKFVTRMLEPEFEEKELMDTPAIGCSDKLSPRLSSSLTPLVFPMRATKEVETQPTQPKQSLPSEEQLLLAEVSVRYEEHCRTRADERAAEKQQKVLEMQMRKAVAEERLAKSTRLMLATASTAP